MTHINSNSLSSIIMKNAHKIQNRVEDYDSLMSLVGDAQIVLLGEASHGTREFYHERAVITKRMITKFCFNVVAIEGDWPDACRVNQHLAFNIGFTTFSGTVTAASDWNEPVHRRCVLQALPGNYESLFHDTDLSAFLLDFENHDLIAEVRTPRLERAIGVVYRPDTERVSHYFVATLPSQFEAILHIDETHAVEPLNLAKNWQVDEVLETYPFWI